MCQIASCVCTVREASQKAEEQLNQLHRIVGIGVFSNTGDSRQLMTRTRNRKKYKETTLQRIHVNFRS